MKEFSPIAFLAKDQVEQMHKAVLRVLSETGIHLPHAEARKLIKAAGAKRIKTEGYSFQKRW